MDEEPLEIEQQEQELYEHHRFTVDRGQEALRLDIYLQMRLSGVSRTKIQAAAKAGCIQVNDKAAKPSYKVKPQDVISVLLPEPPHEFELTPEKIDFPVVYEDDEVLVIDKPAGLVVHPGVGNWTGTLVNGLLHYLGDKATPYLVHRIDKDTSGLLLVAKTEEAQVVLAKQFFDHTIERKYNALVWGDFDEDDGTIVGNLARSPRDRRIMAVCDDEHGKHAVTHWHVLERFGYVTLVECVLETGRTHQIRVHMAHIGHPIFADEKYGGMEIRKGTVYAKYKQFIRNCFEICPRQALHAKTLGFVHPGTKKWIQFDSQLPSDMTALLDKWRKYSCMMPEEDE